ncbi:hypothetical protein HUG15_01635 [Salicibibacter cibarius]|uniref:Uncharacterized protein n=1 Tax=Salicibibacter cibarius TaxID=2743000 RepID=A0A7T7CA77_9BACI|nr:hypothetical protein [Salicibibacter cibarius]QQK74434.1 hypothetical protein HUG15_01635 [Salicibibacter cibarius]
MEIALTILFIFIGFSVYFFHKREWPKMLYCIIITAMVFTMSLPMTGTFNAI